LYYLTIKNKHYSFTSFCNPNDAYLAFEYNIINIHDNIKCKIPYLKNNIVYYSPSIYTTMGRLELYHILPSELNFNIINKVIDKNECVIFELSANTLESVTTMVTQIAQRLGMMLEKVLKVFSNLNLFNNTTCWSSFTLS